MSDERNENGYSAIVEQGFKEVLGSGNLDEIMTPPKMVEALIAPNHYPVLHGILQRIGNDSRSTYVDEWNGNNLQPISREVVLPEYKDKIKALLNTKPIPEGNLRFWALSQAHARGDKHKAITIYNAMNNFIGPKLSYDARAANGAPGDFHIMFKFLAKHANELNALFPPVGSEMSVDRASALIGVNGKAVGVDHTALNNLLESWKVIIGQAEVGTARLEKGKISGDETGLERAGSTSITRYFERLFVESFDMKDADFADLFGLDDYGDELRDHIEDRLIMTSLVMMSILKDRGGGGASEMPIKALGNLLKIDLSKSLNILSEAATIDPNGRDMDKLSAIDPTLGVDSHNIQDVLNTLIGRAKSSVLPGFGTPSALLFEYTELKLSGDVVRAEQLEKLMLYAIRLQTNPQAIRALDLDQLISD